MGTEDLFPLVEAAGTPFEIGRDHGSKAGRQVHNSIETYRAMFRDCSGVAWADARDMAARYVETIGAYCPDYLEEMRGVADGAGVDMGDILALNVRSELVFGGKRAPEGCTAIAVTPERSRNGDVLLGQNWDWKAAQRESMIVLRIRQANGKPDIVMFTEAGIIGKIGFNSAGVGVCLNALATDAPAAAGLPLHFALRGVLEARNLTHALLAASAARLACAANFLIAHRGGEAVDVEIAGDDFDVLYPRGGVMVHTNHFVSPRLPRPPRMDALKRFLPDSFVRLGRSRKLLEGMKGAIGVGEIKSVLRDHGEYPSGICRHDDPFAAPGKSLCTVFSVIMNLSRSEAYLCPANPCDTPYRLYNF